jgi:hypothetical protein
MESDNRAIDSALYQPADLGGLVDYQSGSIVSRTLVKKPTGNVTLFAFDAGQELSEHGPRSTRLCRCSTEPRN